MAKQRRFVVDLIREVLRLKFELNKTNRNIGRVLNISKSTVANYVEKADAFGLKNYKQVSELDDDALKAAIFPSKAGQKSIPINYEYFFKESRRPYVTLQLLWKEEFS